MSDIVVHPTVYGQLKTHYEYLDYVEFMPHYEAVVEQFYAIREYREAWFEGDAAAAQILAVRSS